MKTATYVECKAKDIHFFVKVCTGVYDEKININIYIYLGQ